MSAFSNSDLNTLITAVNLISSSFQTIANLGSADFDAAITDIGATETTLVINSSETVSTNVTVPATCTLMFVGAGELSIDVTKTVTINGYVVAEKRQIFTGSGTATLNTHQIIQKYWWDGATTSIGLGVDPSSILHIKDTSGTAVRSTVENSNSAGYADIKLGTDGSGAVVFLRAHGSTDTDTFGSIALDNHCLLETYQCDGLIINSDNAGGTAKLYLATEDSIRVTIDENGNAGFGTTTPDNPLHSFDQQSVASNDTIQYPIKIEAKDTLGDFHNRQGVGLQFENTASSGAFISAEIVGQTTTTVGTEGDLKFRTATSSTLTDRMIILNDGSVGIGDMTPPTLLSVEGTITVNSDAKLSAGSSQFNLGWGTDRFHFFDDHKIAVGTATPDAGIDWQFVADDTTAGMLVAATTGGDARYYLSNVDTLWHMSLLSTDHLVIAEGAAGNVVAKFDPTNHNMTIGGNTTPNANCTLEIVNGPVIFTSYTVATLPTVVAAGFIYVSDESGGATVAFSDGTNWRRSHDRAIVS